MPWRHGRVGDDDVAVGRAPQDRLAALWKLVCREALLADDEEPQTDLREAFSRAAVLARAERRASFVSERCAGLWAERAWGGGIHVVCGAAFRSAGRSAALPLYFQPSSSLAEHGRSVHPAAPGKAAPASKLDRFAALEEAPNDESEPRPRDRCSVD